MFREVVRGAAGIQRGPAAKKPADFVYEKVHTCHTGSNSIGGGGAQKKGGRHTIGRDGQRNDKGQRNDRLGGERTEFRLNLRCL